MAGQSAPGHVRVAGGPPLLAAFVPGRRRERERGARAHPAAECTRLLLLLFLFTVFLFALFTSGLLIEDDPAVWSGAAAVAVRLISIAQ